MQTGTHLIKQVISIISHYLPLSLSLFRRKLFSLAKHKFKLEFIFKLAFHSSKLKQVLTNKSAKDVDDFSLSNFNIQFRVNSTEQQNSVVIMTRIYLIQAKSVLCILLYPSPYKRNGIFNVAGRMSVTK